MARSRPLRETGTTVSSNDPFVARRIAQHLANLERSNYNDALGSGGGASELAQRRREAEEEASSLGSRKRVTGTTAVKMLLMYRKPLDVLIKESNQERHQYLSAVSPPSTKPNIQLCSVCGYRGIYGCKRCALRYCSLQCQRTHDEMRCERRGR